MYLSGCLSCVPTSGHLPYLSNQPYYDAAVSNFIKKHNFQIAEILQANSLSGSPGVLPASLLGFSTHGLDGVCPSQPSGLASLQALCANGMRNDDRGKMDREESRSRIRATSGTLKFGINRILSEEFGKDKTEKETKVYHSPSADTARSEPVCSCSPKCTLPLYNQLHYSSASLSAVHSLQPPHYHVTNGIDALPGPYSVLTADHSGHSQPKRKRSWSRAVFSNLQRKGLEKRFEVQKYVTKPDRRQLAAMLGLTDAQVKVWFQNRRMKWRHSKDVQQRSDAKEDGSPQEPEDETECVHIHDDSVSSCGSDVNEDTDSENCETATDKMDVTA